MIIAYLITLIISIILLIGHFKLLKEKNKWITTLFVSVLIVNLGYFLLSISKTVSFALFANKVAYLGSVVLPMCLLMTIIDLLAIKYKKALPVTLFIICGIIFLIICTTGYLPWYYESVDIIIVNGGTLLVKQYGPLHALYLIYLIIHYISMLGVILYSTINKKIGEYKYAVFLSCIVLSNIAVWFVEQKIKVNFEFLSISYLLSEVAMLSVHWMIEDFKKRYTIQKISNNNDNKLEILISKLPSNIKLSARELDILEKILENKKRKEIANELRLSENTIKTYTRNLYNKLNVTSREDVFELLK